MSSALTTMAVASVLYAVYSIAGSTPSGTSSSPCVPASVAVDIYAQTFPGWLYGLNNTFTGQELEENCFDVCKKWKGTCRGVAKDAQKCLNSYVSKSTRVLTEVCKTESDRDIKKNCTSGLKADLADLKNFTKIDVKQARNCCEDFLERCVLACFNGNATPYIEPTCSGIPPLSEVSNCI
jgi:hypothetical protein